MLASDDEELVKHCRYLATQARQPVLHYDHHEIGYNYRMSNVLAAIGTGQLEVLPDRVARKQAIFSLYEERLGVLPGIEMMPEANYGQSTRWLSVMLVAKDTFGASPLQIIEALEKENIESRPVWNPLHLHKAFAHCRCVGGEVAKSLYEQGICLPSGTAMTDAQVERVCNTISSLERA